MKIKQLFSLALAGSLMLACHSTREVTRVEESAQIDLSGRWNDTDSRLVAQDMVSDALSHPWLSNWTEKTGKRPVVIVGLVQNRSSEHIAMETFINDIERAFINSGQVRVVQGQEFRDDLRAEKADQQNNASRETIKRFGMELGADFIMQGEVSSITDSNGRTKLMFYQTSLELTNIETNEKVWIGDKKIKKVIE